MTRILTAALAAFFVLTTLAAAQVPDELPALVLQAQTAPVAPIAVTPTSVVAVPWGDMIATFLGGLQQTIATLLLALATALLAMLPKAYADVIRPWFMTKRVNQLFENAAAAAIGGVVGAVKGRTWSVSVTNDAVRELVKIALTNGAPAVLDFAGRTARSLAEKGLARLHQQGAEIPAEYSLAEATAQAGAVLKAIERE